MFEIHDVSVQHPLSDVTLQLLYGPEVIPKISDRLYAHPLVHLLHFLRAHLRDTDAYGMLLALCLDGNETVGGKSGIRGREVASCGGHPRAHHVCTAKEETNSSAVNTDPR